MFLAKYLDLNAANLNYTLISWGGGMNFFMKIIFKCDSGTI